MIIIKYIFVFLFFMMSMGSLKFYFLWKSIGVEETWLKTYSFVCLLTSGIIYTSIKF